MNSIINRYLSNLHFFFMQLNLFKTLIHIKLILTVTNITYIQAREVLLRIYETRSKSNLQYI